jgi:hypothetical protein
MRVLRSMVDLAISPSSRLAVATALKPEALATGSTPVSQSALAASRDSAMLRAKQQPLIAYRTASRKGADAAIYRAGVKIQRKPYANASSVSRARTDVSTPNVARKAFNVPVSKSPA